MIKTKEMEHITEKLKRDNSLLGSFKKDPVKAMREFLGEIALPDDMLEKIAAGVKGNLSPDGISGSLGAKGMFSKGR